MRNTAILFAWLVATALPATLPAAAQDSLDVTFRYFPDLFATELAFLPGSFNGWGQPYQGNNACILEGDEAQMTFVRLDNYWRHTVRLEIGETYEYKMQSHLNVAGTECIWLSDPLNPDVNPQNNNNSVLAVADPMLFQPAEELSPSGLMGAVSAGLFGTAPWTSIVFTVNGIERSDGLDFYDAETGLFRYELEREIGAGAQFKIEATNADGATLAAEIGRLLAPIEWRAEAYTTVDAQAAVTAFLTRLDGSVDPALTEATLLVNGEAAQTVTVADGLAEVLADLVLGANELVLEATIDGQAFTSDPLVITRRLHPLDAFLVMPEVSGSGFEFNIELLPYGQGIPPDYVPAWTFDAAASTTTLVGGLTVRLDQLSISGTAATAGELYFDVDIVSSSGLTDRLRVAVIVEADGTVRPMAYEENAAWIKNAVVYEIFPLSFGPEATGTPSNPGDRFNEITAELDYIAQMGFNTIWFMPIYDDPFMDQLSGGYNIINFYEVDAKLGTNDDFKALVARAHELGIKIILDLTPNHVSPQHKWVNSLRNGGPYAGYIQTEPSNHDRGLDGRGANLPEIWQVENGGNLYRKYDGFGDLANVDWDDDDLQAEMLDIIAFWVNEFDIDGWRLDVYWGPWRKYGPERFGRPLRELMKRIKPDAWLLGEIAGTGDGTEVYYADDDAGSPVVGGLDAAYDWTFYHDGIRGTYGSLESYDARARNGGFWPGPNARYFRFLENHDETRIAELYAGTPERILPLTGFLLSTTGIPMIYQGQEANFGAGLGFGQRAPVTWETARNDRFIRYHQQLAQARQQFPAFGTQDLTTLGVTNDVYRFVRPWTDQNAVVAINFSGETKTATMDPSAFVDLTTDGPVPYYDLFADTLGYHLGAFTFDLAPYETVVYITDPEPGFVLPERPALPYGAIYTGVEAAPADVPRAAHLHPNYPNPFNPSTTIPYTVPTPGAVRLSVYDLLGRRVALLVDGRQAAGTHTVRFDAQALPSGTYLYRLETAGQTRTRPMILLR